MILDLNRPALVLAILAGAGSAWGQGGGQPAPVPRPAPSVTPAPGSVVRSTGDSRRDTLLQMMKPLTVEFSEQRLEDVMSFIQQVTGADMEVLWVDDRNASGLDKDVPITLRAANVTALDLVEKVLERSVNDATPAGGSTWQMAESGSIQIGPKERLNKFRVVKIYSIADLLTDLPRYDNAPDFDLQSVLQSGQGGGGGQSPFQETDNEDINRKPQQEKVDETVDLITSLVEPEQWADNGGDGGTIRFYQGSLIVNAPDYMHRQLGGYSYWPSRATRIGVAKGRRYVTLGVDTAIGKVDGFRQAPVTAVAPGLPPGGG